MVNALREFIARVPENFSIDIPDLDRLMGEVDIQEIYIKKADRTIRALYYSTEKSRHSDAPVLTYLHGGGWVALAPENYDLVCRKFSLTSNINVICPDYRLLPEHPFPASFDDCYDTYLWLKETNDDLLFDRDKIFLGGDSAGGAMTASLIHRLHDEEKPLPIGILMLSPATDLDFQKYESFRKSAPRQLLLDPALAEFEAALYVPYEMKTHPYVSPVYGDLSYFPPTLVMNGQDDPLTDDASNFVQKLKDSGVSLVDFINCEGMPHVYHTNLGMCPESEAVYEDFDNFFKKCLN